MKGRGKSEDRKEFSISWESKFDTDPDPDEKFPFVKIKSLLKRKAIIDWKACLKGPWFMSGH